MPWAAGTRGCFCYLEASIRPDGTGLLLAWHKQTPPMDKNNLVGKGEVAIFRGEYSD